MIDHVSIAVRDLSTATAFYEAVLSEIGFRKLDEKPGTCGFGKRYPEFWINARPDLPSDPSSGFHVCLRARSVEHVRAFYRAALALGATADGQPGLRPEYDSRYYASFVRDHDGNRIEVVTFVGEA
ncbi:MAG: VOC family protein [Myxococcota bacterium]